MQDEDIDPEQPAPRGVLARYVMPGVAGVVLAFAVVGSVWEFSQDIGKPAPRGDVLVSSTFPIDTPPTQASSANLAATVPPAVPAFEMGEADAVAAISAAVPVTGTRRPAASPARFPEGLMAYGAPTTRAAAPVAAVAPEVPAARSGTGEFVVFAGRGRLNVRSGPDTAHDKVFTIRSGERVEVVARGDGWTEILLEDGRSGWASSEFLLSPEDAEKAAQERKADAEAVETMTAKSGVNARSGPGRSHGTVFTLAARDKVTVLGREKGWVQVKTGSGKSGWVYSSYLR
jgi:SH3 domain protein